MLKTSSATEPKTAIRSVFELPRDLLTLGSENDPPPEPAYAQTVDDDVDQLVLEFRSKLVRYTGFERAMHAIHRCHHMGRHALEEPSCLLIIGVSGCGKSTLRKEYSKRYPDIELDDRTKKPILHLELPSQPTIKNVAERILIALGDPFAERGSAEGKTARIIKLILECSVELVILDEFQHFVDNAGDKVEAKVADWLKHLINATKVPFVLMGLPRCQRILEVNEQLRRRFTPKIALEPFSLCDTSARREFGGLLKSLQKNVPLQDASILVDKEIIPCIFYATFGLIDYIMKLIVEAIYIAACERRGTLDRDILGRAFRASIWVECEGEKNPFHPKFEPRLLNRQGEPFYGY